MEQLFTELIKVKEKYKELQNAYDGDCECNRFFELLPLVIDGEATPEEKAYFMNRIDKCSLSLECYNIEKSVKEKIVSGIEKRCCPESLADSIKNNIRKTTLL